MKVLSGGVHSRSRAEHESALYLRIGHGYPVYDCLNHNGFLKRIKLVRSGIQRVQHCGFEFALGSSSSSIFMEISIRCTISVVQNDRAGERQTLYAFQVLWDIC